MASSSSAIPARSGMTIPKKLFKSYSRRRMHNSLFRSIVFSLFFSGLFVSVAHGQAFPRPRPDTGPKPKNVRGLVTDAAGKPISGARVFVRDVKTKTVRTLETDAAGEYRVLALTPTVDYE